MDKPMIPIKLTVDLLVAGSTPVRHPIIYGRFREESIFFIFMLQFFCKQKSFFCVRYYPGWSYSFKYILMNFLYLLTDISITLVSKRKKAGYPWLNMRKPA